MNFSLQRILEANETLHQIICSIAEDNFEQNGSDTNLFGLKYAKDEHIVNGVNRTDETYRKLNVPTAMDELIILGRRERSQRVDIWTYWESQLKHKITYMKKNKIFKMIQRKYF